MVELLRWFVAIADTFAGMETFLITDSNCPATLFASYKFFFFEVNPS